MIEGIWKIQRWGLVLLIFLSFFPRLFHLQEYLFFTLLILAIGTAWWEQRPFWIRSPIDLPLLCFVGWVLLSIPFALDPAYSLSEWQKLAAQVLVFYWVLLVVSGWPASDSAPKVLVVVMMGTVALSGYALLDFVQQGGTWKDRLIRARVPSSSYNELGTYMVMTIPLLLATLVVFRQGWQRVCSGGSVCLAFLAEVFSYSRAGWLGMVLQGVAFGVFTSRRRVVLFIIGGCLVIGGGLLIVSRLGYHQDTVDPWTWAARIQVWQAGLGAMIQHPILGMGYGNDTFTPIVQGLPTGSGPMALHNTFLMVGVGSGVPALLLLVWVLAKSLRVLVRESRQMTDGNQKVILLATAIMVVGFAVRNLFDYMFAGSLAYLFWLLLATGFGVAMSHTGWRRTSVMKTHEWVGRRYIDRISKTCYKGMSSLP